MKKTDVYIHIETSTNAWFVIYEIFKLETPSVDKLLQNHASY